jgi:SAM-dependent methyltransferase
MSTAERTKWDERYGAPGYLMGDGPKQFLVEWASLLPASGDVLDLACGEGQNLVWLAGKGLRGTGVDVSSVGLWKAAALATAAGVEVDWVCRDLEEWDPGDRQWDVVVCSHFLLRDLVPKIRRAVRPCGLVLMELLTVGSSLPPRYLVEPNEPLRWFPDFRVLRYAEFVRDGAHVARIAARRP